MEGEGEAYYELEEGKEAGAEASMPALVAAGAEAATTMPEAAADVAEAELEAAGHGEPATFASQEGEQLASSGREQGASSVEPGEQPTASEGAGIASPSGAAEGEKGTDGQDGEGAQGEQAGDSSRPKRPKLQWAPQPEIATAATRGKAGMPRDCIQTII